MESLWDLCDIHVINLYSRHDRYEHIVKELQRVGIHNVQIHRFHKHPISAALGLFENVISILSKAIMAQKPILILEDDAMFIDSTLSLLKTIKDFMASTTLPWDTIRLGYNKAMFTHKLNDKLYIGNAVTTTGNIYSLEFANRLVNKYQGRIPDKHIDHELAKISGRNIIPEKSILTQGFLGSDNKWPNEAAMHEFLANPIGYQEKFNNMGKTYFESYKFVPKYIKYY